MPASTDTPADAARLETIEFKLAHLEHTVQELNDVVVRQQQEIDRLRERGLQLTRQIESLGGGADATAVEVPPHY